jgi:hypothetical protein
MSAGRRGAAPLAAAAAQPFRRTHRAMAVRTQGQSEEALATALEKTGAVLFAEPDYLQMPALVPNDPSFGAQWHHQRINTLAAWDITFGNPAILAAVLDAGVDATHPDLGGKVIQGFNSADGTTDTAPIGDHGTAVAGVIGQVGDNGRGGAGIAWRVKILPVKITNSLDGSAWCSDMASGIEWAADRGAKVINLSYGTSGCPKTIAAAAQYARNRGALVVVAAGNQNIDLTSTYPEHPSFMMVGATDQSDARASFSNFGTAIDLSAPGVSILTTRAGGDYVTMSGTSFSAPMAAGAAALLYSLKPTFSPADVQQILSSTARDIGSVGDDSVHGHGLLDIRAAVAAAQSIVSGNRAPIVQAGAAQTLSWPAAATLNAQVSDDGLPRPPGRTLVQWTKLSGPGQVSFDAPSGASTHVTFSYAGRYVLRITADDGALRTFSDVTVTVNPGPNGEGGLPAPILKLPPILSVKSRISASYPAGYNITHYEWTLQPAIAAAGRGVIADPSTIAATWSTNSSVADLSMHSPAPGRYRVSVQAFGREGIISEPAEAFVTLVLADLNNSRVFPNPWRSDRHSSLPMKFDQLTESATIKIFSVAGHIVRTLRPQAGTAEWDLKNDSGDRVGAGLYLFSIQDNEGQHRRGKLAILH